MAISSLRPWAAALSAGATAALVTAGAVAAVTVPSAGAHGAFHTDAATPACATSALKVSLGRGQPGAGSAYWPLEFTNKSGQACTLRGFPGVSAITGSGHQIGNPASREPIQYHTVTLAPGKARQATIRVFNTAVFSTGACQPVTSAALRIFPPNQTQSVTIRAMFSVCSKKSQPSLFVRPVQ